ncbi:MAG: hypothetical protein ACLF0P_01640 [Thermoanaerobaculia bacterium]
MRRPPPVSSAVPAAAVLVFAAAFCWSAGQRGFFALDQSIPFDAGWRVLDGQVPFRDFVLPVGPVVPWVVSGGLRLFGADFAGYLATACALNVLAAALAMMVTARLLPGRRAPWLLAGVLTGIWFQGPVGTPWFEPLALLAALPGLGFWACTVAQPSSPRLRAGAGAAAGASFAVTFLAKQNGILAAAPAACLLLALEGRVHGWRAAGRRTLWVAAGGLGIGALFVGWLALVPAAPSQPAPLRAFVLHVLEIPGGLPPARFLGKPWELARIPWAGAGPPAPSLVLAGLASVSALVLLGRLARPAGSSATAGPSGRIRDRTAAAGALGAGLFYGGNLLALTTRNQPETAFGLSGLVVALGLAVAADGFHALTGGQSPRPVRLARFTLAGVAVAVIAWRGAEVSLARTVHEGVARAERYEAMEVPSLRPLQWAVPTALREATVERATLERLLRSLKGRPGEVFVFPDWTILYGLLGRPSPQPLLWFHPGLTYPRDDGPVRRALDRRLVASLADRGVETVVLERTSWLGTAARLADFPLLRGYLERCFAPEEVVGLFEVRSRRGGCTPEPPGTYSTTSMSSTSKVRGPAGLPSSPA